MIPSIFSAYFVVSQHSCTLHWRFRVFFCVHWRFLLFFRLASIIPSIFPLCIDNSEHFSVYIAISQHPCTFTLTILSIFSAYIAISQHSFTLHWRFRALFLCTLSFPSILSPYIAIFQHPYTFTLTFPSIFLCTLMIPSIISLNYEDSPTKTYLRELTYQPNLGKHVYVNSSTRSHLREKAYENKPTRTKLWKLVWANLRTHLRSSLTRSPIYENLPTKSKLGKHVYDNSSTRSNQRK